MRCSLSNRSRDLRGEWLHRRKDLGVLRLTVGRFLAWRPLNLLFTGTLRFLIRVTPIRFEFVRRHLPRFGTVKCVLPDGQEFRMWTRGDDWVSSQAYWEGWQAHEPECSELFYKLARQATNTLDIGAHTGIYSLYAGLANPKGKVYSFEPFKPAFERMRTNVLLNHLDNVACINAAVGKENSRGYLIVRGSGIGSGSGLVPLDATETELGTLPVQVVKLDDFVERNQLDDVNLIKVDVEGSEADAIEGMSQTLASFRPHIFCEVLDWPDLGPRIEQILRPNGYRYYLLTSSGPILQPTIVPNTKWRNYLFTLFAPEYLARVTSRGCLR